MNEIFCEQFAHSTCTDAHIALGVWADWREEQGLSTSWMRWATPRLLMVHQIVEQKQWDVENRGDWSESHYRILRQQFNRRFLIHSSWALGVLTPFIAGCLSPIILRPCLFASAQYLANEVADYAHRRSIFEAAPLDGYWQFFNTWDNLATLLYRSACRANNGAVNCFHLIFNNPKIWSEFQEIQLTKVVSYLR